MRIADLIGKRVRIQVVHPDGDTLLWEGKMVGSENTMIAVEIDTAFGKGGVKFMSPDSVDSPVLEWFNTSSHIFGGIRVI